MKIKKQLITESTLAKEIESLEETAGADTSVDEIPDEVFETLLKEANARKN